ncbi:hypothetical protein CAMGR0001_2048 [Campylobacter gracilis RM3268]|uniref:Uncharacterized protein n=1 Tax=Campylobacter gracilis RM3268 TaxID=553220 RepID=C8PLN8_9BACT|nr:hypothetical protein CAMGR0001_2048 [Campylobacter gracilis RM3268]
MRRATAALIRLGARYFACGIRVAPAHESLAPLKFYRFLALCDTSCAPR